MSSINTMTTFGAPSGAVTSNRGGGVAVRTSKTLLRGITGSRIGNEVLSILGSGVTAVFCALTTKNAQISGNVKRSFLILN
jgi:hypothetical protein